MGSINQKYLDRAMRSRDPRFAKIFGRMGYDTRVMVSEEAPKKRAPRKAPAKKVADDPMAELPEENDPPVVAATVTAETPETEEDGIAPEASAELDAVSQEYETLFGRKPGRTWDAARIRSRIDAYKEQNS